MADEVKAVELRQKHLKGLKFTTSTPKEVEEDGRKKTKHIPVERPLRMDDLLTWTDKGDVFGIVTKDGRKYDVPKNPKNAGGEDDKANQE